MLPATAASATVETHDPIETQRLAAALGRVARSGDRVCLFGPLGAGKTQFAKGFAAGLGVTDVVNSPSFTLMAEYEGRLRLFHLDLYRISGVGEALGGGLLDERQAEGVTITEWADRLGDSLDRDRLEVRFTVLDEDRRRLELLAAPAYEPYIEALVRWRAGDASAEG
ncbi:MAG: tRNA (adenosine(37)-N6)-threonylcarbamoyltransferase complex ATPase subunit type 1 TsaE [Chloroflexi bacterium]|nr:tRNA (adenosine(37)-N6)-threonylcarbamoyltransferase complex ATPase subunit type 1 TsaE [Chloroflexota bacterium]